MMIKRLRLLPLWLVFAALALVTLPALLFYSLLQKHIIKGISSGAVKVSIGHRFKLSEAQQAHEALESRATTGSTLLIP